MKGPEGRHNTHFDSVVRSQIIVGSRAWLVTGLPPPRHESRATSAAHVRLASQRGAKGEEAPQDSGKTHPFTIILHSRLFVAHFPLAPHWCLSFQRLLHTIHSTKLRYTSRPTNGHQCIHDLFPQSPLIHFQHVPEPPQQT